MTPTLFEADRLKLPDAIRLTIASLQTYAERANGRPAIDILNAEEHARIEELIEANTWPQKWTGDEPVADELLDLVFSDGSVQPLLAIFQGGKG